ncbi:unnamed protein product [Mucor hiemalis]
MAIVVGNTTTRHLGKRRRSIVEGEQLERSAEDVERDVKKAMDETEGRTVGESDKVTNKANANDTIHLNYGDESLTGVKNAIFRIGYKKLLGKPWSDDDYKLLEQIFNNPLIDLEPPLANVSSIY